MTNAPVENSFFRWIRGLGVQRGERRWIGGVSSGLAQRLGIDPALARGLVLIVVIFSGIGLLLYGLAWALLPEPDGRIHLQEAGRGQWSGGMTGAVIFVALGLINGPSVFGGWRFADGESWWGDLIWTAIVVGAIIWFLTARNNRRNPTPYDGGASPSAPYTTGGAGPASYPMAYGPHGTGETVAEGPAPRPSSPAAPHTPAAPADQAPSPGPATTPRGPRGTTPTAPRPAVPPRPVPPRTPALPGHVVAIVLGLAVLVGGAVILTSMNGLLDYNGRQAAVALAAALTVMGAGLIGAAIRKLRGGALTGFTIVVLIPTLLVGGFSAQRAVVPGWAGPIAQHSGNDYTYVFHSGDLDLTGYGQDMTADTTLNITNVFSSLKVTVPDNVPVRVTGDAAFYSMEVHSAEGNQKFSGIAREDTVDINPDATGPALNLVVEGAFNSIDITSKEATP